jgi:DNA sulfur modification protein DndE
MSLETVRLSQRGKEQLIKLKRVTGIKQWNILCRWALCVSLADPTPPLVRQIATDSNVEMTWKTFAGNHGDLYLAFLRHRCLHEAGHTGTTDLGHTLAMHLHRGIGVLAGDPRLQTIEGLVSYAGDPMEDVRRSEELPTP